MPQTAQGKCDQEGITVREQGMLAPLGQHVEEVVAQPIGEGDVPTAPEVGHVHCEVRPAEVFRELNAEQQRRADGNICVA